MVRIIIGNNKSDKAGINYILQNYSDMRVANKELRDQVMELFNIDRKHSLSFNMVRIRGLKRNQLEINTKKSDITLIKLRTSARYLPENPRGFTFGLGDEFKLAKKLKNFEFCFVSLHPRSRSAVFVKLDELNRLIKNKRVQVSL